METHIIQLGDISHGGDAVGELGGKVVFVPYGIPGETVRIELLRNYARYCTARIVEVLEPSPDRTVPPCPHFGRCGGCQWQHVAYPRQLALKQHIVASQMERIGKLSGVEVLPVIGMEEPWSYRNNVQYGITPAGELGFQAFHSHTLVPISECWIAHPLLEDLAGALDLESEGLSRITLRAGANTGETLIIFEGQAEPDISVDFPVSCVYQTPEGGLHVLAGDSYYHEQLAERMWQVSAPSFFQVNTLQAEQLIRAVDERLHLTAGGPLIDAYCGVGTFALSLARPVSRVVGIEESPWAIYDAEANRRPGERADFYAGATENLIAKYANNVSAVILDPPRAGCAPEVLGILAEAQVPQIIYASCDPATLARDLGVLVRAGYEPGPLQPIDMFPQTAHVETVVRMSYCGLKK